MDARDLWRRLTKPPPQNSKMADSKQTIGDAGERCAEVYLNQKGMQLIARNYRCRYGEIDLVMRDGDCVVFVEVKRRKHARFGTPLEMVSISKQGKLRFAAEHYIATNKIPAQQAMRFDVVGILSDGIESSVQWVQNAF